jgi:hypothetical protein
MFMQYGQYCSMYVVHGKFSLEKEGSVRSCSSLQALVAQGLGASKSSKEGEKSRQEGWKKNSASWAAYKNQPQPLPNHPYGATHETHVITNTTQQIDAYSLYTVQIYNWTTVNIILLRYEDNKKY